MRNTGRFMLGVLATAALGGCPNQSADSPGLVPDLLTAGDDATSARTLESGEYTGNAALRTKFQVNNRVISESNDAADVVLTLDGSGIPIDSVTGAPLAAGSGMRSAIAAYDIQCVVDSIATSADRVAVNYAASAVVEGRTVHGYGTLTLTRQQDGRMVLVDQAFLGDTSIAGAVASLQSTVSAALNRQ